MTPPPRLRRWIVLLALGSIALNVALLVRQAAARHRAPGAARDPDVVDIRQVVEQLRREGAPRGILSWMARVLNQENNQKDQLDRLSKALGLDDLFARDEDGKIVDELQREGGKSEREKESDLRRLRWEYGPLPDARLLAIKAAQDALRMEDPRTQPPLEQRMREVMTTWEYADFLRYHSGPAKDLRRILDPVDVTEAEYFRMVDTLMARETRAPSTPRLRSTGLTTGVLGVPDRNLALVALRDILEVLGDERFLAVASRIAPSPASLDLAYRKTSLPAATRVDRFFRALEFEWAYIAVMRPRNGPDEAERKAGLRPVAIEAFRELTAGLTPAEIADFKTTFLGGKLSDLIEGK